MIQINIVLLLRIQESGRGFQNCNNKCLGTDLGGNFRMRVLSGALSNLGGIHGGMLNDYQNKMGVIN